MSSVSCVVPPYCFRRVFSGSSPRFVLEVFGYGRVVFRGLGELLSYSRSIDRDFVFGCVVDHIVGEGKFFSHSKPISSFRDAVVVFALKTGLDLEYALNVASESCFVLSDDLVHAVAKKCCDWVVVKEKVPVKVWYRGKDVLVRFNGSILVYEGFLEWRRLLGVYKFYLSVSDVRALIGEFKYGFIVMSPSNF